MLVEKAAVALVTHSAEQGGDGCPDVIDEPKIDRGPAADVFGVLSIWTFFTLCPGRNSEKGKSVPSNSRRSA